MDKENMMGYGEALKLTLDTILPLDDHRTVDLAGCRAGFVFEDLYSRVDSPSIDASMKEGYAVGPGD
nr:molybdopterin molybdenumtransferase MoeA [Desulfobacula sp.]